MASKHLQRRTKTESGLENDLQTYEAGRESQKPPTPFVGNKPNGKSQIKPFLEIYDQKMLNVFLDRTLSQDDKTAKRGAIRTDYYKNLQGILTPDQYTQWMAFNRSHATPPAANSQTQPTLTPATPQ